MTENKTFKKGAVIFAEKDIEYVMYDIVSGKVGIYTNYGKDGETLLTELDAGKYFGEMGVIDAMPRSATAVALEDTEVLAIPGEDFESYLESNPEKVLDIFAKLCQRLRVLSADYTEACDAVDAYLKAEKEANPESSSFLAKVKKLLFGDEEYWQMVYEVSGQSFADVNSLFYYY